MDRCVFNQSDQSPKLVPVPVCKQELKQWDCTVSVHYGLDYYWAKVCLNIIKIIVKLREYMCLVEVGFHIMVALGFL